MKKIMKLREIKTKTPLKRGVFFTDIHFGRKNSSDEHNTDCNNFVKFMCEYVKNNNIDHIGFLGDWFEVRSAISGKTLDWSYKSAKMINDLGVPVFFIVGNHDLHNRNNRDIFNTQHFAEFNNFYIINEMTVVNDVHLYVPYMFQEEYDMIPEVRKSYSNVEYLFGHLDIQGFVLTGEHNVSTHGLNANQLSKFSKVYSGHYHKRQTKGNITYIGNPFPMDYSDANDYDRGLMVYDFEDQIETFINWKDCPTYVKVKLSEALKDPKKHIKSGSRATFIVDMPISFEEANTIREKLSSTFNLRELSYQQTAEQDEALTETDDEIDLPESSSLDDMIIALLRNVEAKDIDNEYLIKIYKGTKE